MAQVKIDTQALRDWLASRPETQVELAKQIGRTSNVWYNAISRGSMSETVLAFVRKTWGLPDDAFLPKEKTPVVQGGASGYHLTLSVHPDKLRFGVSFGEEEIVYAWSQIRGDKELDLIKSISYAAHMCYKFAEQKTLNG